MRDLPGAPAFPYHLAIESSLDDQDTEDTPAEPSVRENSPARRKSPQASTS